MNRTKAFLLGSTTTGLTSAYVGGIGVSGLGGAIGIGFLPATVVGGLVGIGVYEVYKAGERKERSFRNLLAEYDRRIAIRKQF